MITFKTNADRFAARVRATVARCPVARRAGTVVLTHQVMKMVVDNEHRDTNRHANGWAMAANAAGCGPLPVRSLNKSSVFDKMLKHLTESVEFYRFVYHTRFADRKVTDRLRVKWAAKLEKAEQRLRDFLSTQDGAVVVFNLYGGGRAPNFRHKIYGGTGRIVSIGDRTYAELHNLEAHTTVVERRFGMLRRAMSRVRGTGFQRAGKGYVAKLKAMSGGFVSSGTSPW